MALNVVLYKPFVSVLAATSPNGYSGLPGVVFGSVSAVYPINVVVNVGDNVSFLAKDSTQIIDGTLSYYIVDENLIFFKELAVP